MPSSCSSTNSAMQLMATGTATPNSSQATCRSSALVDSECSERRADSSFAMASTDRSPKSPLTSTDRFLRLAFAETTFGCSSSSLSLSKTQAGNACR